MQLPASVVLQAAEEEGGDAEGGAITAVAAWPDQSRVHGDGAAQPAPQTTVLAVTCGSQLHIVDLPTHNPALGTGAHEGGPQQRWAGTAGHERCSLDLGAELSAVAWLHGGTCAVVGTMHGQVLAVPVRGSGGAAHGSGSNGSQSSRMSGPPPNGSRRRSNSPSTSAASQRSQPSVGHPLLGPVREVCQPTTIPVSGIAPLPSSTTVAVLHDALLDQSQLPNPLSTNTITFLDVETQQRLGTVQDIMESWQLVALSDHCGGNPHEALAGSVAGGFCASCCSRGIPWLCYHKQPVSGSV